MQQPKSALVLTCSLQHFRLGKDEEEEEAEMKGEGFEVNEIPAKWRQGCQENP